MYASLFDSFCVLHILFTYTLHCLQKSAGKLFFKLQSRFSIYIFKPCKSRFTYMAILDLNMTNTARFNNSDYYKYAHYTIISYPMKVGFAFRASAVAGRD